MSISYSPTICFDVFTSSSGSFFFIAKVTKLIKLIKLKYLYFAFVYVLLLKLFKLKYLHFIVINLLILKIDIKYFYFINCINFVT
jgi:hypothetical protein